MIKLRGPSFAEAGSTVCVTASGVGSGFSVVASTEAPNVILKIAIDNVNHAATIYFVVPSPGITVSILATDASSARGTTHTVGAL
jgi:hypothetical protein